MGQCAAEAQTMKKDGKSSRRDLGKAREGCETNKEERRLRGKQRERRTGQHQNEVGGELERSSRSDKKQTAQVGDSVVEERGRRR